MILVRSDANATSGIQPIYPKMDRATKRDSTLSFKHDLGKFWIQVNPDVTEDEAKRQVETDVGCSSAGGYSWKKGKLFLGLKNREEQRGNIKRRKYSWECSEASGQTQLAIEQPRRPALATKTEFSPCKAISERHRILLDTQSKDAAVSGFRMRSKRFSGKDGMPCPSFTSTNGAKVFAHYRESSYSSNNRWEVILVPTTDESNYGLQQMSEVVSTKHDPKHHTLTYVTDDDQAKEMVVRTKWRATSSAVSKWMSQEEADKLDIFGCTVELESPGK